MKENYNTSQNKKSSNRLSSKKKQLLFSGVKRVVISLFLLLFASVSFSQEANVNKKNDSLNSSLIQSFNKKLTLVEGQRINDSIKRSQL
jgi:hypothetical protein